MKNPYAIVKKQRITEKAQVLEQLQNSTSNRCVERCESPKYVFDVDIKANKNEIAKALEEIYKSQNIRVKKVNTLITKPKKRRVRGRIGKTSAYKKAIVTLEKGDAIETL
jgi:large subunit ribosomal protein L23